MKKLLLLVLCFLLSFSLMGCGVSEETEELLTYINEDMAELAELEEDFKDSYESVRGDNYVDDATMYEEYSTNTLEILDKWEEKAAEISKKIKDTKISKVHTTYISYIAKCRNVINTTLGALEDQDRAQITKANDMLVEASELVDKFNTELEALAEEYDVEIER